jgi:hypothetical protein
MEEEIYEPVERYIEIEVPNDAAIIYYEAGIKTALEEMERIKAFLSRMNELDAISKMSGAIQAMQVFLETVQKTRFQIIQDCTEWARQHQAGTNTEIQATIVTKDEEPEIDDDDDMGL